MANTLSEEAVVIVTRGVMEAERQLNRLGESMSKIAGLARAVAAGGAFSVAGILRGAAQGTVEGEQFSRALERLTRIIGDAFAPYVRDATRALIDFGNWFKKLSPETRDTIAKWSLLVVAGSAVAGVLPIIIRGVAGLAGVLRVVVPLVASFLTFNLAGPGGGFVIALAAVTAAALYMFGVFDKGFRDFKDGVDESVKHMAKWQFEVTRGLAQGWGRVLATLGIISKKDLELIDQQVAREQVARGAARREGEPGFRPQLAAQFETPQGEWERLVKAFASRYGETNVGQAQLGELKKANENLQGIMGGLNRMGDMVPAVR
jgi:hypothetical protein